MRMFGGGNKRGQFAVSQAALAVPPRSEENRGVLDRKSSCSPCGASNLRIGCDGVKTKTQPAAAKMACMKNFDSSIRLSQEMTGNWARSVFL